MFVAVAAAACDPAPPGLGVAVRDGTVHVYLPDCGPTKVVQVYVEHTTKLPNGE